MPKAIILPDDYEDKLTRWFRSHGIFLWVNTSVADTLVGMAMEALTPEAGAVVIELTQQPIYASPTAEADNMRHGTLWTYVEWEEGEGNE